MSAPDLKPRKRVRDKDVFRRLHEAGGECLACGSTRVQLHHILSRAQGGDDCEGNLVFLCGGCHGAYHGNPYLGAFGHRISKGFVESAIGRYIRSEAGDDARWYLTARLGPERSVAFLEDLDV